MKKKKKKLLCWHTLFNIILCLWAHRDATVQIKIKIYTTVILPFVLYGRETCLSTLREERRLRVFKNRVLRRICGSKWDKVKGEWRKLHNEELNDLSLPSIIQVIISRRMRWVGHVAHMVEWRGAYRILSGKPNRERERPLGRPRCRWKEK